MAWTWFWCVYSYWPIKRYSPYFLLYRYPVRFIFYDLTVHLLFIIKCNSQKPILFFQRLGTNTTILKILVWTLVFFVLCREFRNFYSAIFLNMIGNVSENSLFSPNYLFHQTMCISRTVWQITLKLFFIILYYCNGHFQKNYRIFPTFVFRMSPNNVF